MTSVLTMHRIQRTLFIVSFAVTAAACQNPFLRDTPPPRVADAVLLRHDAEQHYQIEDWPGVVLAYRRLTLIEPDNAQYWFRLGNGLIQNGRTMEGIDAYHHAVALAPEKAEILNNLALTHLREATRAMQALQRQDGPDNPRSERTQYVIDAIEAFLLGQTGAESR